MWGDDYVQIGMDNQEEFPLSEDTFDELFPGPIALPKSSPGFIELSKGESPLSFNTEVMPNFQTSDLKGVGEFFTGGSSFSSNTEVTAKFQTWDLEFVDEILKEQPSFPFNTERIPNPQTSDLEFIKELFSGQSLSPSSIEVTSKFESSESTNIPTDMNEWLIYDNVSNRSRAPLLYEFLFLLLSKPHYCQYASYKNMRDGIFQIHEPEKVANLWEEVKGRQATNRMTYDKFARAIRWYYKCGKMVKTNTRYTFQFSQKILEKYQRTLRDQDV